MARQPGYSSIPISEGSWLWKSMEQFHTNSSVQIIPIGIRPLLLVCLAKSPVQSVRGSMVYVLIYLKTLPIQRIQRILQILLILLPQTIHPMSLKSYFVSLVSFQRTKAASPACFPVQAVRTTIKTVHLAKANTYWKTMNAKSIPMLLSM